MTRRLSCFASALVALAVATSGVAQSPAPSRRAHHALGYDDAKQRVLLTAGSTPLDGGQRFEFFNDLWAFDGTRWTSLGTSGDRMSGNRLAFDSRRNRMVSFGGFFGTTSMGVLRVLDSLSWRTIGDHTAMPAAEAGFVYDSRRDRFVAFGGSAGRGQAHGDTWEYDGTSWAKAAVSSPPARGAVVMAFDEKRGKTVLFGGAPVSTGGQPTPPLSDTWEYDGRQWTQIPVTGPSGRHSAGITYDSKRGVVILFGGLDSAGFKADTWSWNGTEWRKLADGGPEPRAMGYIAYDKRRDRVVLFGGRKGWPNGDLDDTWEWDGAAWHRVP